MPRKLAPLSLPPVDLENDDLPLVTTDQRFVRIHRLIDNPGFWGRTGNNRFDAPGAEYGVLYAAKTFDGAFIETFGDISPRTISVNSLTAAGVATVAPSRLLRLVDLAGPGLARLGLDARVCTDDHSIAQAWSHSLWAHPSRADGIWYAARHDAEERSVALFDRTAPDVAVMSTSGLMDSPQGLVTAKAIEKYGFALIP